MWRSIHSIIGLFSAVLLVIIAFSGGILSTQVVLNAASPFVQDSASLTLADALKPLVGNYQEIEKLKQKPNGSFVLTHIKRARAYKIYVDIRTGQRLDDEQPSEFYAWMRGLHRSLLLEQTGRIVVGIMAAMMCLLCLSGSFLIIRRQGGLLGVFSQIRGHWSERLHTIFGRLAVLPLIIIGVTGAYMSLVRFDFIPATDSPAYPESARELAPVAVYDLKAIQNIQLADIQEVVFPIPDDWFDIYTVKLKSGYIFVDQFTGEIVSQPEFGLSQKVFDWIMFLHTAEGSAVWAVILGVVSLAVPIFAVTGSVVWYRRKKMGAGRIRHNVAAHVADMVILVGSESGSTWGFAKNLHVNLTQSGVKTHINQLNKVRHYPNARHLFVLTATYGDGDAPQNAQKFEKRIRRLLVGSKYSDQQKWSHSVLAFGDKAFPNFCGFGHRLDDLLTELGRPRWLETLEVNKKSSQTFSHWGALLKLALAEDYMLTGEFDYSPPRPKTQILTLCEKQLFGEKINADTVILKFIANAGKLKPFVAGDLVGILPPDDNVARLYSVGSSRQDGHLEICVRLQQAGKCSTFLHGLNVGENIDAYMVQNADFHLPKHKKPIMLIGAGTGIAPFVGMIRQNVMQHPISLYWGGRDPEFDFLYEDDIRQWLADGQLTDFYAAFSRVGNKQYVQDIVAKNAKPIADNIMLGGTVMVCGGAAMAQAVREVLTVEFEKNGLTVEQLKHKKQYLEDIY